MTMPNGPDGMNPGVEYGVSTTGISGLASRTREAITSALQAAKFPSMTFPKFTGKLVSPGKIAGFDASKVTTGTFVDSQVPGLGTMRDAIYQAFTATTTTGVTNAQLKTAIATKLAALEGP